MSQIVQAVSVAKMQLIQSLHLKKMRQKYGYFIVEGDKMANEILSEKNLEIAYIIAEEKWLDVNDFVVRKDCAVYSATSAELKKMSQFLSPPDVIIVAKIPEIEFPENFENAKFIYLDDIQDPGNVGTIIRTADWFGFDGIFLSPNCADVWNPKVVQSSMGSVMRMPFQTIEFSDIAKEYPIVNVIVTVLDAPSIFETALPSEGIMVVGNESRGINTNILRAATHKISIPRLGSAESLNVGVATGICCALWKKS